jgi:RimJ/RimL family protein N-acetyltransferase
MTIVLDRNPVTTPELTPANDIRVRRMTRADEAALDEIFAGLSERSRFLRYHSATPRLTARMRRALLDIDGTRHLAHMAEVAEPDGHRAIGVARLFSLGAGRAEVAVEVVDAWHRRGVGALLLKSISSAAAELGYVEVHAEVLPENRPVRRLLAEVFPNAVVNRGDGTVHVRDRVGVSVR